MELNAPFAPGWARATCSGPVKASLLFRLHNSEGVPIAEGGVNAAAVPATRFVTFAEQGEGQFGTGVAYANPSPNISVPVTFTARDTDGEVLASVVRTLLPGGHDAHGMAELFGFTSFTGSIEVTSTEPIVSLSINAEAAPVFSSLPPGELDAAPDIRARCSLRRTKLRSTISSLVSGQRRTPRQSMWISSVPAVSENPIRGYLDGKLYLSEHGFGCRNINVQLR